MVALSLLAAIASTLSLAAAAPTGNLVERADTSACTTGSAIHIIVARGSNEAQGEGVLGQIATMVKSQLPGSTSEGIVYPATLVPYASSEAAGVAALTNAIQSYTTRCPSSRYSGAHAVGDTLCGSFGIFGRSNEDFDAIEALDASSDWKYEGLSDAEISAFSVDEPQSTLSERAISATANKNLVAILLTGDPTWVPGQSYNAGTSTRQGIFPRPSSGLQCLNTFASRTRSYCDANDSVCASGFSIAVHLSYVAKYGTEAATFVVNKARAA
ncbi:hypothetical protein JCM3775_005221 [Rhodotorula graminis]|uniref:Carbohydrate esterase family 5 protein n=1 Tax=Rhodotorula graminis (strain WP1) TaxID=578459 RepID=A0A0P9GXY9_RHOGW|nr:carbohydrate esterase family 5 protein [Rhodotorula graminis WP1]KPV72291.1 carbohydrate esterase family 5 protein [Rhodotorula graminis WP1]